MCDIFWQNQFLSLTPLTLTPLTPWGVKTSPQLAKKISLTNYIFLAPYPLKTEFRSICALASKNSLHFLHENATFLHLVRFRAGKVMPKLWLLESTFLTSCCDSNQGLHTRPVWRGPEGKSPKIQIQLKPKFYYGN